MLYDWCNKGSSSWGVSYERFVAVIQRVAHGVVAAGFLSRCHDGPSPYV